MSTPDDFTGIFVIARSEFMTPHYPIVEGVMGSKFHEYMDDDADRWTDWLCDACEQAKDAQQVLDNAIKNGMKTTEDATGIPGAYGMLFIVYATVINGELEGVLRELTDEEWERAKKGEKVIQWTKI